MVILSEIQCSQIMLKYNKIGSLFPSLTNLLLNTYVTKSIMGISIKRSVPKLTPKNLKILL